MQAGWRPKPLALMGMPDHGTAAAEMKSFRGKRQTLRAIIDALLRPAYFTTSQLRDRSENLPRFYRLYIGKESVFDHLTKCTRWVIANT